MAELQETTAHSVLNCIERRHQYSELFSALPRSGGQPALPKQFNGLPPIQQCKASPVDPIILVIGASINDGRDDR
jgi:hypothetical protein